MTRGFPEPLAHQAVDRFRLGVVDDHPQEYLIGRLSIPYMTMSGMLLIKYRCIKNHDCKAVGCPKYLYDDGEQHRLFNAGATLKDSRLLFVTEGEFDAIAIQTFTGLPAVAVPGRDQWVKHRFWSRCFTAFPLVVMPADGDKAGRELAKEVSQDVPQLRIAHMPTGMDANDVLSAEGVEGFLTRCDLEDWIGNDQEADSGVQAEAADPAGEDQ